MIDMGAGDLATQPSFGCGIAVAPHVSPIATDFVLAETYFACRLCWVAGGNANTNRAVTLGRASVTATGPISELPVLPLQPLSSPMTIAANPICPAFMTVPPH